MDNYTIINYDERFASELKSYIKSVHGDLSKEYISFSVDNLIKDNQSPSLLVLDGENRIVGCHLYFFSEMLRKGQSSQALWGHETFLNKECRKYIGLDFVLRIKKTKGIGIGLSEINTKIFNKLHGNFLEGLNQYIIPTLYVGNTVFRRLFKVEPTMSISCPKEIKVKEGTFVLVEDPEDFWVYNDGFWCNGQVDVDFKRDRSFISYRFFNDVKKYNLYQLRSDNTSANCYFVIRPIVYKGFGMLSIVDYRYKMGCESFNTILKAVNKIALQNRLGALYLMSSDPKLFKNRKLKYCSIKWPTQIVSGLIDKNDSFFITSAETDVDFLK